MCPIEFAPLRRLIIIRIVADEKGKVLTAADTANATLSFELLLGGLSALRREISVSPALTLDWAFCDKLGNHTWRSGATMETIGFIGLGNMGGPVAGHIQRAGFPMVVFDLRDEATRSFSEHGAKVVDSARDLARQSDIIITALPMPKDVEQIAAGVQGILEGIKPGSVYHRYLHQSTVVGSPPRTAFSRQRRLRARRARRLRSAGRGARHSRSHGRRRPEKSSSAPSRCCAPSAIKSFTRVHWAPAASASSCIK